MGAASLAAESSIASMVVCAWQGLVAGPSRAACWPWQCAEEGLSSKLPKVAASCCACCVLPELLVSMPSIALTKRLSATLRACRVRFQQYVRQQARRSVPALA